MQLLESPDYSRTSRSAKRRRRTRLVWAAAGLALVLVTAAFIGWRAIAGASAHAAAGEAGEGSGTTPTTAATGTTTPGESAADEPSATPTPAVETTPTPSRPATISVAAVGDMIFDRRVKSLVQSAGGLAPLRHVSSLLADADITVGNLESPLSSGGVKNAAKDVTFRGDPRGIEGLKASGFDFLSLANNHVLDYGPDALADTVTALDGAGIGHAGAGPNKTAAWTPAVREVRGANVAFLSFSHILPAGFIATDSKAGLARGRGNMEAFAAAIKAAKAENDYVIVSFHWGVEYQDNANGEQVRDAHTAIDAGADMVLSHHPHVIQGIEFYKGRLIAYSSGDFVFDHYSRKTGEAFILDANLGPNGVTDVVATPVYLDTNGAPKVVTGSAASAILTRLEKISSPHGTNVAIASDIARLAP